MGCAECLFELDLLLLAEAPATAEEEGVLAKIPKVTGEDVMAARAKKLLEQVLARLLAD